MQALVSLYHSLQGSHSHSGLKFAIIVYTILRRGAGIGIQDSLKNYCPFGLKGSSPFPGIPFKKTAQKAVFSHK